MQSITSLPANRYLRVIVQGPPKSGKTVLACQFPRPYVLDLDRNLAGAVAFCQTHGLAVPVGWDRVDQDEKGLEVPPQQQYTRLAKLLLEAQANDGIDTIVLDSGTILAEILINEVLRQQNKQKVDDYKDPRQFWGHFAAAGTHLMGLFRRMNKHIIIPLHEKFMRDAQGNIVYPVQLTWPGQVGERLGLYFTDVWRCETKTVPNKQNPLLTDYEFVIRTMPDTMYKLGNGLGLPPVFKFDWKIIAEKLNPTISCPK